MTYDGVEVLRERNSSYSIEVALFGKEQRASVYFSNKNEFEELIPDFILNSIIFQVMNHGFLHHPIKCNSSGKWVMTHDEVF